MTTQRLPKPADVTPDDVPEEVLIDTGVPGIVTGTPKLSDYGTFAADNMEVLPDASGSSNIVGAQQSPWRSTTSMNLPRICGPA